MKRKRKSQRRKIIIVILLIIVLLIIGYFISMKYNNDNSHFRNNNSVAKISDHYNEFVKTNKEAKLYNNKYEEIGTVGKNVELSLAKEKISKDTKYFKVTTFDEDYYIEYQNVDKINKLTETR